MGAPCSLSRPVNLPSMSGAKEDRFRGATDPREGRGWGVSQCRGGWVKGWERESAAAHSLTPMVGRLGGCSEGVSHAFFPSLSFQHHLTFITQSLLPLVPISTVSSQRWVMFFPPFKFPELSQPYHSRFLLIASCLFLWFLAKWWFMFFPFLVSSITLTLSSLGFSCLQSLSTVSSQVVIHASSFS